MSGNQSWEPWETFKADSEELNIPAPPCPHCKFWKPQRKYMQLVGHGVVFDGVQLCHVEYQEHDFSCYKPKETAAQ